jgi:hypothetical protein
MRRSTLVVLSLVLVFAIVLGAGQLTESAQEGTPDAMHDMASPAPMTVCPAHDVADGGVRIDPLVFGPMSDTTAPDHEMWLYRVVLDANARIPANRYTEGMTVYVAEGSVCLLLSSVEADGSAFYTPAGGDPINQPMSPDIYCTAECPVPVNVPIPLGVGGTAFHQDATYSYLAGRDGAVLLVSVLKPHADAQEPWEDYSTYVFGWWNATTSGTGGATPPCCSGPKFPPM